MGPDKWRLVLVDDHRVLREGLALALQSYPEFEVVGLAADGEGASRLLQETPVDAVVLDVHLGTTDGVVWAKQMLSERPGIKVVILSADVEDSRVREAMALGVSGYVVKENGVEELVRALRFAREGHLYLCPQVMAVFVRPATPRPPAETSLHRDALNERDREIIRLVALGLRNKEISEQMGLSPKSVETYRGRLMKRLGCDSPADLVRWAIREGLVEL